MKLKVIHNDGGYSVQKVGTDLKLINIDPIWWHCVPARALVFKTHNDAKIAIQQVIEVRKAMEANAKI